MADFNGLLWEAERVRSEAGEVRARARAARERTEDLLADNAQWQQEAIDLAYRHLAIMTELIRLAYPQEPRSFKSRAASPGPRARTRPRPSGRDRRALQPSRE